MARGDKPHLRKSTDRKAQIRKACAWGTFGEREREREIQRERERRKWRHHCRAKIGVNLHFTCQKFAQLAMTLHFPLPKIRTFRFSLHTSRLFLHGEVTMVALKFALSSHFPLPERERERERERYRERERERRKWRHHCRAKIGVNLHFPCQKFAQLAMTLHFPLPKIRTFRFSLHTSRLFLHGEVTMVALKFALSSHFPLPKICSPSGFVPLFQMARAARRVIENPRQKIKSCPVLLFFPSKNWIKLIPKTIGNRKRDCAWGGSGW